MNLNLATAPSFPQDRPELLYRRLGAKLVVGMPFKDIATSGAAINIGA